MPKPVKKPSRARRYVAKQLLHILAVGLVHIHHELWRVLNVEAEGLTPSEWKTGQRIMADLTEVRDRLSEFQNSL